MDDQLVPRAEAGSVREAVALLPGLPPDGPHDRYGLRALTALWLQDAGSAHTRRAYYADLAAWLSWCRRTGLDPLAARRADVDAWKGTLTVTGRDGVPRPAADSTTARKLAALSSWYRYLISNDAADRNPVEAVRRPRQARTSPLPALSEQSAAALLDHAERVARDLSAETAEPAEPGPGSATGAAGTTGATGTACAAEAAWRDAALAALLFYTGLRVSAVTGARLADLDHDSGHSVLRYTKKGGVRDLVPLVPPVLAVLSRYLELRAARLGVALDGLTGPLLATTPHPRDPSRPGGRPLVQRDVWNTLRRLAREAGLPEARTITPHGARRTAGTVLLAHGVPVQKVQDLLAHADPRTTRDHYDVQRHKLDTSPAYTLAQILAARRGR
ncbi:tyrosine-type recombinase/integrase [Bailinhaonella thermotolerans]|nr:tyrosine-type recombinase/integrase [Bailinhaonella thermotolerans]